MRISISGFWFSYQLKKKRFSFDAIKEQFFDLKFRVCIFSERPNFQDDLIAWRILQLNVLVTVWYQRCCIHKRYCSLGHRFFGTGGLGSIMVGRVSGFSLVSSWAVSSGKLARNCPWKIKKVFSFVINDRALTQEGIVDHQSCSNNWLEASNPVSRFLVRVSSSFTRDLLIFKRRWKNLKISSRFSIFHQLQSWVSFKKNQESCGVYLHVYCHWNLADFDKAPFSQLNSTNEFVLEWF